MVKVKPLNRLLGRIFPKKATENASENQNLNTRQPSNRRRGWKGVFPRKTTPVDSNCISPNGPPKSRGYGSAFLRHRLPSLFKKKPPVDGENELREACSGPGDIGDSAELAESDGSDFSLSSLEIFIQETMKEKQVISEYCKARLAEATQIKGWICSSCECIINALERPEMEFKPKKATKRVTWKDECDVKESVMEMERENTDHDTEHEQSSCCHLVKQPEKVKQSKEDTVDFTLWYLVVIVIILLWL